jgi:hypothetical protein
VPLGEEPHAQLAGRDDPGRDLGQRGAARGAVAVVGRLQFGRRASRQLGVGADVSRGQDRARREHRAAHVRRIDRCFAQQLECDRTEVQRMTHRRRIVRARPGARSKCRLRCALRPALGMAGLPRWLAEGAGRQPLGHLPIDRRPLRPASLTTGSPDPLSAAIR